MTDDAPTTHDAVKALFDEVADLEPAEAERHLTASAAPPEVVAEVRSLLDWHRETGDFLETAPSLHGLDADLEAALAALPRGQRRAVELRVVGDASYAEVARTLHTTETAARIRVHRGLAGLRTALAESENTP